MTSLFCGLDRLACLFGAGAGHPGGGGRGGAVEPRVGADRRGGRAAGAAPRPARRRHLRQPPG